jgi:hypothetical protein
MSLRVGGIVILLLGIAVAAAGIVGIMHGPSVAALADAIARSPAPSEIDSSTWLHHWRLWGVGIGCGGMAIALSGAALAAGRQWGFLLLATAMIFAATAPWIIQGLGLTRYPYERAGSMETFVFLALSLPAVWGYLRHRSRAADA